MKDAALTALALLALVLVLAAFIASLAATRTRPDGEMRDSALEYNREVARDYPPQPRPSPASSEHWKTRRHPVHRPHAGHHKRAPRHGRW